ncbi:MAG: hypothetical protein ABIF85_01630 [Nanoarchaeota archaeon]|nr:hypothetical protein [Nanoarchaeota archaeon]MBU4300252.1 hypothetical protein [Nanoarchaeota archaeon]MBU4452534.1 hypothetical protein [Nanoarchaeota archaeon]MCG2723239.1 hypothetical protein [archaeon]
MTGYSNITSRFTIGKSRPFELLAVPITRDKKAYLSILDFMPNYAYQNGINPNGIVAVNNQSELFLKVDMKKPVLLNVFPSQKTPYKLLEIPEELYKKYISIKSECFINALVPHIKQAVEFYGAGNEAFELPENWKFGNL